MLNVTNSSFNEVTIDTGLTFLSGDNYQRFLQMKTCKKGQLNQAKDKTLMLRIIIEGHNNKV